MRDRIEAVGRLLLLTAYADDDCQGDEVDKVREILGSLWTGDGPFPADLMPSLFQYDMHGYDLDLIVRPFREDSPEDRRRLMDQLATVAATDGVLHPMEALFLRQVGEALELQPVAYEDLLATYAAGPKEVQARSRTNGTGKPAKKPTAKKSNAKKSNAKKSTAKKSTAKKSNAKKPTAKKPTAKKPTAKKPTAKKPTAKKSTAKKSNAKKPSKGKR